MTRAEALAFNAGVEAILGIAARTAEAIAASSRRLVHEDFAVAALAELAEAGHALLITDETEQTITPPEHLTEAGQ